MITTEQSDQTKSDLKRSKSESNKNQRKEEQQALIEVGKRLQEDQKWIEELAELDQFSFEWVHKVAVEILFQCMGKKEIAVGIKGKERLMRVFKEKPALSALEMIAKMNGHLFDTIKGTVKQTGVIEHNHQHQIELKPDTNRTEQVFSILEACGALNPPKRLTKEDVEVISA